MDDAVALALGEDKAEDKADDSKADESDAATAVFDAFESKDPEALMDALEAAVMLIKRRR